MKHLACLLFLVACEKSGPVEATPGSSSTPSATAPPPTRIVDAGVATLPNDAAQVAIAPDAAPAPAPVPKPPRRPASNVALSEADVQAMANMLTAESGSHEADLSSRRRPQMDLNSQIADVRDGGRQVTIGGGAGRGGGSRVGTARSISGTQPTPNGPAGRISVASKLAVDDTTLTADLVLAKIQSAYMAGLKRCYKSYLAKDASARGKLTLSFTVNESGRATSGKAVGFASEVDDCITGLAASWRFPIAKDKDGEATEASFQFTFQLVPD